MKFKLVSDEKSNMTSLIGEFTTGRRVLTELFGEPHQVDSFDNKVTTRWVLEIDDKTIITIYDYKRYELGAPGLDEIYSWHIGGFEKEDYEIFEKLILEKFNEKVIEIAMAEDD
jgi:hypothetical protein